MGQAKYGSIPPSPPSTSERPWPATTARPGAALRTSILTTIRAPSEYPARSYSSSPRPGWSRRTVHVSVVGVEPVAHGDSFGGVVRSAVAVGGFVLAVGNPPQENGDGGALTSAGLGDRVAGPVDTRRRTRDELVPVAHQGFPESSAWVVSPPPTPMDLVGLESAEGTAVAEARFAHGGGAQAGIRLPRIGGPRRSLRSRRHQLGPRPGSAPRPPARQPPVRRSSFAMCGWGTGVMSPVPTWPSRGTT